MTAAPEPWPLPHMDTAHLKSSVEWSGFVGVDNVDGIGERLTRIIAPGRSFALVYLDRGGRAGAEVKTALTLHTSPDAFRVPIRVGKHDRGGGVQVDLSPGINGIGVSYDYDWAYYDPQIPTRPMTGDEVRARRYGDDPYRRHFDWSWISITGGLDGPRQQDRITVRHGNEHGFEECIQLVPCDIYWGQRHERDALTAEQIADALTATDVDEWHPGAGVTPTDAATAVTVLRQVAANLRRSREPLTAHEVYPKIDRF